MANRPILLSDRPGVWFIARPRSAESWRSHPAACPSGQGWEFPGHPEYSIVKDRRKKRSPQVVEVGKGKNIPLCRKNFYFCAIFFWNCPGILFPPSIGRGRERQKNKWFQKKSLSWTTFFEVRKGFVFLPPHKREVGNDENTPPGRKKWFFAQLFLKSAWVLFFLPS